MILTKCDRNKRPNFKSIGDLPHVKIVTNFLK